LRCTASADKEEEEDEEEEEEEEGAAVSWEGAAVALSGRLDVCGRYDRKACTLHLTVKGSCRQGVWRLNLKTNVL